MSYRDRYLSLDPTYMDAHGLPLLRMTFDWHDNEYKMAAYSAAKMEEIVRAMKPEKQATLLMRRATPTIPASISRHIPPVARSSVPIRPIASSTAIPRVGTSRTSSSTVRRRFRRTSATILPACWRGLPIFLRRTSGTPISNRPVPSFPHEMESGSHRDWLRRRGGTAGRDRVSPTYRTTARRYRTFPPRHPRRS